MLLDAVVSQRAMCSQVPPVGHVAEFCFGGLLGADRAEISGEPQSLVLCSFPSLSFPLLPASGNTIP